MKSAAKKILTVFLCLIIAALSLTPAFAAVTYPTGVTEQTASESAAKTDILIKNAVDAFTGKRLSKLVYPMLFEDETVSGMLTGIYGSLSSDSSSLDGLGIDISPKNVAKGLAAYPSVAQKVASASDWSTVDMTGAKWEIRDKIGLSEAVSAMLSPFNDVLYMILCSGTYTSGIIGIKGGDGYKNGIIAMLSALGCTSIISNDQFKAQAAENPYSMIKNIVLSILSMLDAVLEAPAVRLSQTLPNLAHFIKNGGFDNAVDALMNPLTIGIGKYIPLFSGSRMLSVLSFIQDSGSYTTDFSENITSILNGAMADSELELAEIDLDALASCGTLQNDVVIANIGEAYVTIFRWLIDTLKLNKDKLAQMMTEQEISADGMEGADITQLAESLLSKSTDEILALLIELLTATEGHDLDYQWQAEQFTPTQVTYTANLGQEKYQRVLDGIDELINEFVVEYSEEKSLQALLKKTIYSPELVSTLAATVYGMLDGEETAPIAKMLGISASPAAVAENLTGGRFSAARTTLSAASSWESINTKALSWGFYAGDKNGFEAALVAVLRPLGDILRMLLASDKIEVLGAINLCGSNGYNTAMIPLLEALGCSDDKILTYEQYKAEAAGDGAVKNLLNPLFALIDEVIDKPVYTLTKILPNLLFFVQNGSLMQCLENLLSPVLGLLDKFSVSLDSLGIDLEEMKSTDLISALADEVPSLTEDIKLPKPDIASLASMGQLVTVQSKRTYQGAAAQTQYVQADQTAVLITILRYIVDIIRNPENGDLMGSMMGGGSADEANMFAQYSSGIGEQMAAMTTDETIEWLYKLLFRERAVSAAVTQEAYSPTIIYQPKKDSNILNVLLPLLIILVILAIFAFINRNRIEFLLERRKLEKLKAISSEQSQQEV